MTIKSFFRFPHDSLGVEVYDSMVNRNMIAAVIENKQMTENTTTSVTQTKYKLTPAVKLAVISDVKQGYKGIPKTQGTFDLYDNKGNVLQVTGKEGIKTSYLWGYKHKYVVAKVVGASFSDVMTKVDTGSIQTITSDSALRSVLNNLRTLPNTLVTTITHKPLVAVSSETNPNNRTGFFEYDALGRLVLVRDHDRNIMKKICYNYYWQSNNCEIYYNKDTSRTFTRQCPTGYSGSQVVYTVPPGVYLSAISQADADALAATELDSYGQTYANNQGTCTLINTCNSGNCSGVNKKCVNGICETGIKVYTSSVQIGAHLYECTYHYEWSDGTWSQNYTEQSPTNCSKINEM
jgi:YD repeat-containing protein